MDYRYILIDHLKKTVEMILSESCEATTEQKQMERYDMTQYLFRRRFSLWFNGQDEDFFHLPKKYRKFTKI